jgi:hypothetical protein
MEGHRMNARGVRWAYLGMTIGGAASIFANIAHAMLPASPPPGSVIAAAFWPVALFVTIEILAKNAWPAGARWTLLRWGGTLPVAAVTAVVSYRHMSGLLTAWGEDPLTATIGPIAVDGLLVMSTGAIVAAGVGVVSAIERITDMEPAPVSVIEEIPAPAVPIVEPAPVVAPASPTPVKPAAIHRVRPATDAELADVIAVTLAANRKAGRGTVIAALKDRGLTPGKGERLADALAAHKRGAIHAVPTSATL